MPVWPTGLPEFSVWPQWRTVPVSSQRCRKTVRQMRPWHLRVWAEWMPTYVKPLALGCGCVGALSLWLDMVTQSLSLSPCSMRVPRPRLLQRLLRRGDGPVPLLPWRVRAAVRPLPAQLLGLPQLPALPLQWPRWRLQPLHRGMPELPGPHNWAQLREVWHMCPFPGPCPSPRHGGHSRCSPVLVLSQRESPWACGVRETLVILEIDGSGDLLFPAYSLTAVPA